MAILIKGKNKANAKHSFVMRRNYKNFAFPIRGYPLAIDTWYEKPFYGRTDHDGNAVYLSESKLLQIKNTGDDTVHALDFVVDAFHAFSEEYRKLKREGEIINEGVLANVRAVRGWPPGGVHSMYNLYIKMLYRVFTGKFLDHQERKQKITSIDSFMEVFVEFVDKMAAKYPFTRSGLILSKYSDPLLSGLIIDIAAGDHSDDRLKNRVFIKDPNFSIFRKVAAKHGFMIDKNAPWRLVADINSPKMRSLMRGRGKDYSSLFRRSYYTAHRGGVGTADSDVEELKKFVFGIYNSFITANPEARKVVYDPSACAAIKKGAVSAADSRLLRNSMRLNTVTTQLRETITIGDFNEKYGHGISLFWLRMYLYIRAKEAHKGWSKREFERKAERVFQIQKTLDTRAALDYIGRETRFE